MALVSPPTEAVIEAATGLEAMTFRHGGDICAIAKVKHFYGLHKVS
ncbi:MULTISPECIES: hypothetical protein [Paraburkholderia]|uniref:Uncharacterized protein n=1 Tax=Paraburkholderia megapolitana TaxID=420953 RepID=A0A1I3D7P7_9BURK|nr:MULTISPECIES: hypothetical protein [Paraburkholderia]MCX4166274.1 hypothetical protein [Paraburkholderia megapolitana]MDN7161764.1 hypothetical protein [Paraburkholderia sp. CHISQ3]MDQ6498812.1 hypothetical protein [Paraburkholderia megapolitana]SFH82717.1 hypothetical protein SAMN05192543_101155 [Paraburkholderia megapolitana]